MNSMMIDLETLSTHKDARIMTIAAVVFDIDSGETFNNLHLGLHRFGFYPPHKGHVSDDTMEFWLADNQDEALRNIQQLIDSKPYSLPRALEKLSRFIAHHKPDAVWSNGASFDIAILGNIYQKLGIPIPWHYWQERDTRTLVDISRKLTGIDPKKQIKFTGQKHDALCDAIYQARFISQALSNIKTMIPGYKTSL